VFFSWITICYLKAENEMEKRSLDCKRSGNWRAQGREIIERLRA